MKKIAAFFAELMKKILSKVELSKSKMAMKVRLSKYKDADQSTHFRKIASIAK